MTVMKTEELAKLLRDLAEAVETGDSMEGSLQYLIGENGALEVSASLRTGNREGQGGMILI